MNIFHFSQEEDRRLLRTLFEDHFRKSNFVPFLGAGFTVGCRAKGGRVPSGDQFKNYLAEKISEIRHFSENDKAKLQKDSLNEVSECFWPVLEDDDPAVLKKDFFNYLKNHFLNIKDLSREKTNLLKSGWRYLYTLNFDDAIENALANDDVVAVYPFSKQNELWLKEEKCVYKLSSTLRIFYNFEVGMRASQRENEEDALRTDEMEDVRWFITELTKPGMRKLMSLADRKLASQIVTLGRDLLP